jgi:oxidase EvaA
MKEILDWYDECLRADTSEVEKITFSELKQWGFDEKSGNLRHVSGQFFSVRGISVKGKSEVQNNWEQPIIHQPEIGILGILSKIAKGTRYFLMQAKMEPGNSNVLQLSPTVQATLSNYSRVHSGKKTDYIELFHEADTSQILVDSLQLEQGGRFFQKRNRNIIVEVDHDVKLKSNFRWIKLSDLAKLLQQDNLVNMNARSVLSCYLTIPPLDHSKSKNTISAVLNWITHLRMKNWSDAKFIPLNCVADWKITNSEIKHKSNKYFSVIAIRTSTRSREVSEWTQPILEEKREGFVGFIIKKFNGLDHYLVHAKIEHGNIDRVVIGPTVQYSYSNISQKIDYLPYFSTSKKQQVRFEAILSEEGGRFYHNENKYMAVEVYEEVDLAEYHTWVSYPQMLELLRYSLLNIEARTLMTGINL